MKWKTIRWRLPLSYAAIALLAALSLGAVLLSVVTSYYTEREKTYLVNAAYTVRDTVTALLEADVDQDILASEVKELSFISQTRIQIIDQQGNPLVDTGVPNTPYFKPITKLIVRNEGAQDGGQTVKNQFRIFILPTPDGNASPLSQPEDVPGYSVSKPAQENPADVLGFTTQGITETVPVTPPRIAIVSGSEAAVPSQTVIFGFNWQGDAEITSRRSNLAYHVPIVDSAGKEVGELLLSDGPGYGWAIMQSVAVAWILASAIAVLLAALVGWRLSHQVTGPLQALTQVTARMTEGELSARAEESDSDELGQLGHSFNQMADQIEDTVKTLRRFAADAAHELHTPLTALQTNLELAANENAASQGPESSSAANEFLQAALSQVKRLESLTNDLLDLSRLEARTVSAPFIQLDLTDLVELACEPFASQAEQQDIEFQLNLPTTPVLVGGDPDQLQRVLNNLLDNALKFTSPGGRVTVTLTRGDAGPTLSIADTGIGIPQSEIPYLFQRFHRGQNAAGFTGSGLGLAIVKAILDHHAVSIQVQSSPDGTTLILQFPPDSHPKNERLLS